MTDRAKVFRALDTKSSIRLDPAVWQDPEDMPQNPATLLDLLSVEVANVIALEDSTLIKADSKANTGASADIVRIAKEIDIRFKAWPKAIPLEWFPKGALREHVPTSVADAGFYGECCDIYPDVMICRTWNDWRSTRLKLLSLIAKHDPDEQTLASIQELADGVCASFPFILGDRTSPAPIYAADVSYPSLEGHQVTPSHHRLACCYGGWWLHTPLNSVLNIGSYLRAGQLDWIKLQGQRLARVYDVIDAD